MSGGADLDWEALSSQVKRWEKLARDADEQTPAGDGGQLMANRMPDKTRNQRQQALKAKRKAEGLERIEIWTRPKHKQAIKEYAAKLNKPA